MSWILLTALLCSVGCEGAKILAFVPMGSHSHQITYRPIFRELARRGHNITYVTSIPDAKAPYRQIVIDDPCLKIDKTTDLFMQRKNNFLQDMYFTEKFVKANSRATLSHPEVKQLIHSTEHFDLVFTESMLLQESYVVLGHRFSAPVIELSGFCPSYFLYNAIGNPQSFATTLSYLSVSTDKMDFLERLRNTLMGVTMMLFTRYRSIPIEEALMEEFLQYPGWESRPPLLDLISNISLVLQNTHVATHYPHPYNPNVVEIGGIQLQEPEELPQDLQTYLDNAREGVVYFSFGSILSSSLLPEPVRKAFISALGKLPYKVLWKWETEMTNTPTNIKISKWFPQKDVLAHPNVKVFITHGGLSSVTESIYNAVPMIVIPVFVDQYKDAKLVESAGNGLHLDFENITEASITWSVNTVISNPSFREAAQRQSNILRDNPMRPLDKAIFWIEYVLRHKGAPHLRTAAASLPWYKYYLIDVVALLVAIVVIVIIFLYFTLRTAFRLICRKIVNSNSKKIIKKKNN